MANHVNIGPTVTGWVIVATVILLLLYNVFAFSYWGQEATISKVLEAKIMQFPIIALAIGILISHWMKF